MESSINRTCPDSESKEIPESELKEMLLRFLENGKPYENIATESLIVNEDL